MSKKAETVSYRNPYLEIRDRSYRGAQRHPRLTDDGKVKCDPMPVAKDLIGIRPLSLEEQVARFSSGVLDYRLVSDERILDAIVAKSGFQPDQFLDDDDFHDYLDDIPEDGLTQYEIEALKNIRSYAEYGAVMIQDHAPTPPKEPSPSAPTTQAQANGDPSPNSGDGKQP